MVKRLFWSLLIVLILALTLSGYFFYNWETPPLQEMTDARTSILDAEKLEAKLYAGALYQEAKNRYDSAMQQWQWENEKIFFQRKFDVVKKHALASQKIALQAAEKAVKIKADTKFRYETQSAVTNKKLAHYTSRLSLVPLSKNQINDLTKGKLLLQESKSAYNKEDYQWAIQKLHLANEKIDKIYAYSNGVLENYFLSFPQWKEWEKKAIERSKKQHSSIIIVDKFSRKCYFYQSGKLIHTFDAELGKNWIGDKNFKGDMSTPEGFYKIVSKKSNAETRFYKAFLLNFPNEEDKKRFLLNKKNKQISHNASIGNLIEIHGHGGKGVDWTNGCVALRNEDMDTLYPLCSHGTEVILVGSVEPLHVVLAGD